MDYSMPKMDGLKTTKRIRHMCKENNLKIPQIYCCTAYTDEKYKKRATKVGMVGFMTKPVTEAQLIEILKNLH